MGERGEKTPKGGGGGKWEEREVVEIRGFQQVSDPTL